MDDHPQERAEPTEYEPPVVRPIGTLTELTEGGTTGPGDGSGMAGSSGTIP